MIRPLLIAAGLAELAFGGLALSAIASDIQLIVALCAVGFGLTHLALAAVIGRLPLQRSVM